jgi:hypothetical protein
VDGRLQAAANVPALQPARELLRRLVVTNPRYGRYIAPIALAYVVSHPRFNIYSGRLGDVRLAGLGLDAIPHSAAAYSLSHFVYDAVDAADDLGLAGRWAQHPAAVAAVVLAGLTIVYEAGERTIHQLELAQAGGDESRINMHWSVADTVADVAANALGWLAATLEQRGRVVGNPPGTYNRPTCPP